MSLFRKSNRAAIVLKTGSQRDEFIERLDRAHVDYELSEKREDIYSSIVTYVISVRPEDLKKVG